MPTTEQPENAPATQKRRRGPQTTTVTEIRAHNAIVAALQSLPEATTRARVLKSACAMAQVDLENPAPPQSFSSALSSRDAAS